MRAAHLVRRGWRATIFLALLAGIAGGVAMAAWAAGRRTETAFDHFVARVDAPDLQLVFCPPEMRSVDEETILDCWAYDQEAEAEVVGRLPQVEAAGRGAFAGPDRAPATDPEQTSMSAGPVRTGREPAESTDNPLVVEGRWYDVAAPDEVVINEYLASRRRARGWRRGDRDLLVGGELGRSPRRRTLPRTEADLRVVGHRPGRAGRRRQHGETNLLIDESFVLGGPGSRADERGRGFPGGLGAAPATTTSSAATAAIEQRLRRIVPSTSHRPSRPTSSTPVEEAIDYEARGGAWLRRSGRRWPGSCSPGRPSPARAGGSGATCRPLRALGLTRRQAVVAAALGGRDRGARRGRGRDRHRGRPSPVGPIGVARSLEVAPGVRARRHGARRRLRLLVFVVVIVATWFPVARMTSRRPTRRRAMAGRRELVLSPGAAAPAASPPASAWPSTAVEAGTACRWARRVATVALAAAALAAAIGLTSSLTTLTRLARAVRGAVGPLLRRLSTGERAQRRECHAGRIAGRRRRRRDRRAPTSRSTARRTGSMRFAPVPGVDETIRPGHHRRPRAGQRRRDRPRRHHHAPARRRDRRHASRSHPGHHAVPVRDDRRRDRAHQRHLRGQRRPRGGRHAELDHRGRTRGGVTRPVRRPARAPAPTGPRSRPTLEEAFPGTVAGPPGRAPSATSSASPMCPYVLAGARRRCWPSPSLAHALVLSTRRQRGQLAVLKTLGIQPRPGGVAIVWHASACWRVVAALVGLPLGVIAGRWGWRVVADQLGVASGPVVPLGRGRRGRRPGRGRDGQPDRGDPGWRAARIAPAEALRVE